MGNVVELAKVFQTYNVYQALFFGSLLMSTLVVVLLFLAFLVLTIKSSLSELGTALFEGSFTFGSDVSAKTDSVMFCAFWVVVTLLFWLLVNGKAAMFGYFGWNTPNNSRVTTFKLE